MRRRVIPGNTELPLGDKMIGETDMAIYPKRDRAKFGLDGKWVDVLRNEKRQLIIPRAPKGREIRKKLKQSIAGKSALQPEESANAPACPADRGNL